MIYFDASYIVRLYVADFGFEAVRQLSETDSIASSQHGYAEVIGALHRKHREKEYTADEFKRLLKLFANDSDCDSFNWLIVSPKVLDRIAKVYEQLPATVFLRGADALHLASAAENNLKKVYSNDEKLLKAAKYFGLEGINVF